MNGENGGAFALATKLLHPRPKAMGVEQHGRIHLKHRLYHGVNRSLLVNYPCFNLLKMPDLLGSKYMFFGEIINLLPPQFDRLFTQVFSEVGAFRGV